MPAAAVIRGLQALSDVIGRKACVGVLISFCLKTKAQLWERQKDYQDRVFFRETGIYGGVVKCVDTIKNTSGEGGFLEEN